MKEITLKPIWESEVKGIKCLESETQYGFRKSVNDMRPSSCVWIDKEDFERLHEIILKSFSYNKQFE